MSAPTFGCARIFWNSSGVSGPGFDRMCSGTASLPMSCSSAAVFTPCTSLSDIPSAPRDRGGVELHAADVRLRRLILGVDRERQRFDRRQMQVRHLAHVALLVLDASEIDLVGAVGQVERRHGERRDPVRRPAGDQPRRDRGRAGADEVARRAPQEVLVPDLEDRLVGRERDGRGDRQRVDDEVGRRGADERLGQRRRSRPVRRLPPSRW